MFGEDIKVVPIIVGSVSFDKHQQIAEALVDYFKDEDNFFIISSDFCHWGLKFRYMPFDEEECNNLGLQDPNINDYIEILDRKAIKIIEQQSGEEFQEYLKETKNTI
mmetsp:Transcript_26544/g.26416  ORF Transcript_26544/g.26416 Transcript_26544/m.26416 type:complete len:107 (+) Transcript_26544:383-703(+)